MIENNRGTSRGSSSLKHNIPMPIAYTLESGISVRFKEITVANKDILTLTDIDYSVNPRHKMSLSEKKLKNLARSIKRNQFYAAVGYRRDGITFVIDGSRRRQAAIIAGVDLRILVTDDDIPNAELKNLVKEFQTNENLTLLEWGLMFIDEIESNPGLKQLDLCDIYNKSKSFISRAIQASRISPEVLELFDDFEPLTSNEYTQLKKLTDDFNESNVSLVNIGQRVEDEKCDSKAKVFKFLLSISPTSDIESVLKPKPEKKADNVIFISRKRYVKKQVTQKGKGTEFKCAGLTDLEIEAIESFVKNLIK